MEPRINIVTLGTHNLERATAFYERGLGLPKLAFQGNVSFFALNGTWLALYPWELLAGDATVAGNGSGFRGATLAHVVESKEQVMLVLKQAEDAGAKIIKPAQETDWGGFSGYFSDLDDHLWEVAFNPFFWPGPRPMDRTETSQP
ncbi:MAG: VOC family protein [Alphaproteobacteria bacterium]|nr:VOC family protein [Alphaproteobacteria bacterium]